MDYAKSFIRLAVINITIKFNSRDIFSLAIIPKESNNKLVSLLLNSYFNM